MYGRQPSILPHARAYANLGAGADPNGVPRQSVALADFLPLGKAHSGAVRDANTKAGQGEEDADANDLRGVWK